MPDIHLTNLTISEHRAIKFAALLSGMHMKDFLVLAAQEKIKRDNLGYAPKHLPQQLSFPLQPSTLLKEDTNDVETE